MERTNDVTERRDNRPRDLGGPRQKNALAEVVPLCNHRWVATGDRGQKDQSHGRGASPEYAGLSGNVLKQPPVALPMA